jgi:hypothetical protein
MVRDKKKDSACLVDGINNNKKKESLTSFQHVQPMPLIDIK